MPRAGPGRPPRTVERRYLQILMEEVTEDDWREIVRQAKDDAKTGNVATQAWLSKYPLGNDPLSVLDLVGRLEAALASVTGHDAGPVAGDGAGDGGRGAGWPHPVSPAGR
jgi:hypothetical protein